MDYEDFAGSAASGETQRQVLPQAVTEAALESAAAQVFARGEPLGARYNFRSALQAVRQVRFLRHCSRSDECRLYFDFYYLLKYYNIFFLKIKEKVEFFLKLVYNIFVVFIFCIF